MRPLVAAALLASSAHASPGREGAAPARVRVVRAAERYVGTSFRGDCSAFVRRVYADAGLALSPVAGSSASHGLYRALARVRRPRPGDLAFFHDTYDRNRDGRRDDRFTHVALVEAVDGPRVTLIHRGSHGIARFRMNLARRHDRAENDPVRKRTAADAPGTRTLAGELFAGYASALGRPGREAEGRSTRLRSGDRRRNVAVGP